MRSATFVVAFTAATLAAQGPAFEVASIRPSAPSTDITPTVRNGPQPGGQWIASNADVMDFLTAITGYDQPDQIVGLPRWAFDDKWDINARAAGEADFPTLRKMLLALLTERFALRYHIEKRPLAVMALVRARTDRVGPGIKPASIDCSAYAAALERGERATRPSSPAPGRPSCGIRLTREELVMTLAGAGATGAQLIDLLDYYVRIATGAGRMPIVDRTGLDRFDIEFVFRATAGPDPLDGPAPKGQPIVDALDEQLGLKLEKRTEMLDVMVIDHIEKPTPN